MAGLALALLMVTALSAGADQHTLDEEAIRLLADRLLEQVEQEGFDRFSPQQNQLNSFLWRPQVWPYQPYFMPYTDYPTEFRPRPRVEDEQLEQLREINSTLKTLLEVVRRIEQKVD